MSVKFLLVQVLEIEQRVVRAFERADDFIQLELHRL